MANVERRAGKVLSEGQGAPRREGHQGDDTGGGEDGGVKQAISRRTHTPDLWGTTGRGCQNTESRS